MANDGSGSYGVIEITLTNQIVNVSEIKVKGSKKPKPIITVNKSLQLQAEVITCRCNRSDCDMVGHQRHRTGNDQ